MSTYFFITASKFHFTYLGPGEVVLVGLAPRALRVLVHLRH